ncbi:MAG: hypothetical protein ACREDN_06810, partial [Aestuariivirga sp.]
GEIKVSDLAMDILFGESVEKQSALRKAASSPVLFAEINEKWPERQPSDENLRSFLARKGYSVKVLDQVINAYRDTMSLVSGDSGVYSPRQTSGGEKLAMQALNKTSERSNPQFLKKGFDIGFVGSAIRMSGTVGSKAEAAKVIQALTALQGLLPDEDVFTDEELGLDKNLDNEIDGGTF